MYRGKRISHQQRGNDILKGRVLLKRTPTTGDRAVDLLEQYHLSSKDYKYGARGFQPCRSIL